MNPRTFGSLLRKVKKPKKYDALSIEYGDKYNTIGIHIADVSHFIYSDSYMDREAMVRGNSYYFTEKSFPMLPKNIANNICSLKPDTPRLTLSLFLKLDNKFNIIRRGRKTKKRIIRG